jgi:nicotinic acid mononucleotide adenylyltransferase
MLHFFKGSALVAGRLGIFPGAFNPPTCAHLALAEAARLQFGLDQVTFLLPRKFPHKEYGETGFDDRLDMLEAALAQLPPCGIASTEHGLFIDIARAFRSQCGQDVELYLLCGRDAAERIVAWDYGDGPSFCAQLQEFQMLVASREAVQRTSACRGTAGILRRGFGLGGAPGHSIGWSLAVLGPRAGGRLH